MTEARVTDIAKDDSAHEAPLVQGNLWKTIWTMSWPLVLTTLCSSVVGLVDVQVAKVLGFEAQAAVGLAEQVIFIFMVFLMCAAVGTTAMVSRAFGEKDRERAYLITGQALLTAIFLGFSLTALCLVMAPTLMHTFSPTAELGVLSAGYLSVYSFFLIPFGFICIITAAFRASGDAKTPLFVVLTSTSIAVAGDIATVYYNWPIRGLGIKGIAYAGLAGNLVGSLVAYWRLRKSILAPSLRMLFPMHPELMGRLMKISLPSGFQRWGWAASTFCIFFILRQCPYPTAAIASWTIGMRVEALLFMPMMALSLAISSIVGQNLGANQVERAFSAGWRITWAGMAVMVVLGTLMFIFAPELARAMTTDPKSTEYAQSYLRTVALSEPMLAMGMILSGALQGAGDTKTPMWITLGTQWLYRLPAAWLFAIYFRLGPPGAWAAMMTSMYLIGSLTAWRYQSRAWVKTQV
jgi:putative MATE family efflux protein